MVQGTGFCYPENSGKDQSWVRVLVGGLGSAGFVFECSDSDVLSPLDTRKVAGWLWHLLSSQLNGYNHSEDGLVCHRGGQIKQDSQTSIVSSYNVTTCFSPVEHVTLVTISQVAVGVTLVMSVFISKNLFSVTFPLADWPAGHTPGDLHCCHSGTSSVLLFPCPLTQK